ncbi:MAG TPA: metal-sulfur cluster assembly factor [Patescibacteria group bacterium]|nr:metal-sulfur cluster assembly factor [Patescibacteria group bacterium]
MVTKKQVESVLDKIPDPEIGVSILQLGLIYRIEIDKKGNVRVVMTLTTLGCPLFDQIAEPIKDTVGAIKGVKKVEVELTFDPPWTPDTMSEEAKMQLGFS